MVLEYINTYRLSQEKLKSHLEDVFGYDIITFYVRDDFYVVDVPQSLSTVRVIEIRDGEAGTKI
ncbi:hypothetical protein TMatcc_001587 [Talaromyces marneffei ATCC 18224]